MHRLQASFSPSRVNRALGLLLLLAFAGFCLAFPANELRAQSVPAHAISNPPKPSANPADARSALSAPGTPDKASSDEKPLHSDRELLLSYSILVFGLCVLIVQYLLLRKPRRSAYEILQLLAINLIVTGTLFLISAGFDARQIAPGLGLLGTVAGYVLGRKANENSETDTKSGQDGGG